MEELMLYMTLNGHEFPHDAVKELIPTFLKQGAPTSAEYRIEPREGSASYEGGIVWSTPHGLRLVDGQNSTLAMVSLSIIECAVIVRQLQGVKGRGTELRGIRWPRLLVKACIAFAEHNRALSEVRIVSAKSLVWYAMPLWLPKGRTLDMHRRDMMRLYDGNARDMLFKWSDERNAFYRVIRTGA